MERATVRAYSASTRSPAASPVPSDNVERLRPEIDDDHELTPFPVDCLPGAAGDMSRAIAAAEHVPTSLTGSCVLGILSASIGCGLEVRSGAQRKTRGNLFILASAQSGTGKSESFRHAVRPLHEYERDIIEAWRRDTLPGLQAERDLLESEINHLKKQAGKKDTGIEREATRRELEEKKARLLELDSMMQAPVLTVEDITTERLASLLAKRGEVLASLSPDAGNIVSNLLGRYNKLDRTDESIYLKSYSGDYTRCDRIGRDPVVLHQPCLTVLWLTQPDKLDTLLGERSLTDGGMIPRLLTCHTNCLPTHITGDQSGIPGEVLSAYDRLIRDLLKTYRQAAEAWTVEPEQQAMQLLTDHHNAIVDRRRSDLKDVTSFAARWTEQAWRLSVVLHAAKHGASAHEHHLSAETATAAITIADWYAAQQLDILSGGRWRAKRDRQKEVLLLLADIPEGITAREVYRARIAKTADDARDLLATMEQDSILEGRDITPERGGWTHRLYTRKQGR
jgi:replicative DNA helicase